MLRRSLDALLEAQAPQSPFSVPEAFLPFFDNFMPDGTPVRYKVALGGRGGAKSHTIARVLVAEAYTQHHLILCTREYQNSIADSVYRVVLRQIEKLGLSQWFETTLTSIRCRLTGSEFIFKGLRRNIQEIRSLEGVTRCWIEEAQWTTSDSWLILDPTIREPGSQILVSYNPVNYNDPTHQMFAVHPPKDALVIRVGWRDNPWFPAELDRLRRRMLEIDPDAYDWVWEGSTRKISAAAVFRNHYVIEGFETPEVVDRFFYGVDWGFSNDPLFATRSYIVDDELYVDYEFCQTNVELDEVYTVLVGGKSPRDGREYDGLPGIADWPVKADNARPETISYCSSQGLNIDAAEKWHGSVEDGIAHLKAFRRIHIHPRCVNLAMEFRLYSYKVDPKVLDPRTGEPEILPVIIDKHNHGIDSMRYALDGYIQHRGGLGVWAKL